MGFLYLWDFKVLFSQYNPGNEVSLALLGFIHWGEWVRLAYSAGVQNPSCIFQVDGWMIWRLEKQPWTQRATAWLALEEERWQGCWVLFPQQGNGKRIKMLIHEIVTVPCQRPINKTTMTVWEALQLMSWEPGESQVPDEQRLFTAMLPPIPLASSLSPCMVIFQRG